MSSSEINRLGKIGVVIHVKYTPDLIETASAASSLFLILAPLTLNGMGHEGKGNTSKGIDRYENVVSISTSPIDQVEIFRLLSLNKCEYLSTDCAS